MASTTYADASHYAGVWKTSNPFHNAPTDTNRQLATHAAPNAAIGVDNGEEATHAVSDGRSSSSDSEMTKVQSQSDHDVSGFQEKVRNAAESATSKFHLQNILATGPSGFFNPTNVRIHVRWKDSQTQVGDGVSELGKELALLWRSRDNRKGRKSTIVPRPNGTNPDHSLGSMARITSNLRDIGQTIRRMLTSFPYWDMSFWSGWSYSIGSILFLIDGSWSWETVAFPDSSLIFPGQEDYAVGICFFVGALFYQIGATMAYFEAVNDGSFHGSAMRRLLEGHEEDQKKMLDEKIHHFVGHLRPHPKQSRDEESADALANEIDPWSGWTTKERSERPGSMYLSGKKPASRRGGVDLGEAEEGNISEYTRWRWWPTWHALRTHHIYEIGYVACTIQLFGATLYGMCGVVALPGILDTLEEQWQENAAYWVPQIVASCCFLTAGSLFTLETQEKCYKPEVKVLGWWIGAWATAGSCGFLMCAICGLSSISEYQSDLASLWGSGCYLISSLLQWYEALNKHPVGEFFSEPGEMKSSQVHPI